MDAYQFVWADQANDSGEGYAWKTTLQLLVMQAPTKFRGIIKHVVPRSLDDWWRGLLNGLIVDLKQPRVSRFVRTETARFLGHIPHGSQGGEESEEEKRRK